MVKALDALDADPSDPNETVWALGQSLLRDANRESSDPTERQFVSSLEREDAADAERDAVALEQVRQYAAAGYRERIQKVVTDGQMSDHTKSVIDAGAETDKFAYGTNVSNALLRDSYIAEIDPDSLETFRHDAIAAPRQYDGMVRADYDKAFEQMDYAQAVQLRNAIASGDEKNIRMAHHRLAAQALSQAKERTSVTAQARLEQEASTLRPSDEAARLRRDDLMDAVKNPRGEVAEAHREAAGHALAGDSSEPALKRGVQAAVAQAARRTRERDEYLNSTLKAQMDKDLDEGKRSYRMDKEAREMIASGTYSTHTRALIDSARMPYAESQRGAAIEALARDAVLARCVPSHRKEVVDQVGRDAYESMPREAAQRLERDDVSGAIEAIRAGRSTRESNPSS